MDQHGQTDQGQRDEARAEAEHQHDRQDKLGVADGVGDDRREHRRTQIVEYADDRSDLGLHRQDH
ncbi:hypothetical protein D3C83_161000 [compost metagenome]